MFLSETVVLSVEWVLGIAGGALTGAGGVIVFLYNQTNKIRAEHKEEVRLLQEKLNQVSDKSIELFTIVSKDLSVFEKTTDKIDALKDQIKGACRYGQ